MCTSTNVSRDEKSRSKVRKKSVLEKSWSWTSEGLFLRVRNVTLVSSISRCRQMTHQHYLHLWPSRHKEMLFEMKKKSVNGWILRSCVQFQMSKGPETEASFRFQQYGLMAEFVIIAFQILCKNMLFWNWRTHPIYGDNLINQEHPPVELFIYSQLSFKLTSSVKSFYIKYKVTKYNNN